MYRGAICCTFGGAGASTTKNKLQIYHASVNWVKSTISSIKDSIIRNCGEECSTVRRRDENLRAWHENVSFHGSNGNGRKN